MRNGMPVLATIVSLVSVASVAVAGVGLPYQGPDAYTSFNNSPFSVLHGFDFCVEDFEDGTLDVPGVVGNGGVVGPGGNIDSVDADDGVIDGSGTGGHSYFSGDGTTGITFTFTKGRTNGYPTKVALVWTDGGGSAPVFFEAFDADGNSFGLSGPHLHADNSNNGETAEDRVYATIEIPGGISAVRLANIGGGIEVDHLQLDRCIVCGDTNQDLHVKSSDALVALKTSVGTEECRPCICDANGSHSVTSTDALFLLRKSVGLVVTLACPACTFG